MNPDNRTSKSDNVLAGFELVGDMKGEAEKKGCEIGGELHAEAEEKTGDLDIKEGDKISWTT